MRGGSLPHHWHIGNFRLDIKTKWVRHKAPIATSYSSTARVYEWLRIWPGGRGQHRHIARLHQPLVQESRQRLKRFATGPCTLPDFFRDGHFSLSTISVPM